MGSPLRVVLGVSGGIAAYKAASLLRLFTEAGHQVQVVPTQAALAFVGAPTWEALSGRPVSADVFSDVEQVPHVRLGQQADLVVVAPATADLLAKAAHGLADDLLTNVLLTARCPVLLAPAMHTEMWQHPATVSNVATLRARGVAVLDPAQGRLTGADTGPGRLPEPDQIRDAALALLQTEPVDAHPDWHGRQVVVTAGGTREPLDPVRYLGNRSSGKQGYALAAVAAARGARVTLISSASLPTPDGDVTVVPVETALELQQAVTEAAAEADVVVMAAAVADFRPENVAGAKIKKDHREGAPEAPVIHLVRNPDILRGLVLDRAERRTPVLVGFAAETGDESGSVLEHARQKLARKGCDLLVANEVGVGVTFGQDESTVHLLTAATDDNDTDDNDTAISTIGPAGKDVIAAAVWDAVAPLLPARPGAGHG